MEYNVSTQPVSTYTDPTVVAPSLKASRIQSGAFIAVAAGIVAVLFSVFLLLQTQQTQRKISTVQQDIAQKQTELNALSDTKAKLETYDEKAKGLHILYDGQTEWKGVLAEIEKRLYHNMALSNFQLSDDGKFTFSGVTKDYVEYAKIYASLTSSEMNQHFVSVQPTSLSKAEKSGDPKAPASTDVMFSFDTTLSPTVLRPVATKTE